jgi:hypothetical protein
MQHNIILPDLGQTTSEAKIVQWLKKPGDHVSRGEAIVAVETDKVDMEVEAFESGYLRELLAEEGSMASALAPVAILTDLPEENYDRPGEHKAEPPPAPPVARAAVPPANPPRGGSAAPAARALAKELGVDLTRVEGTGSKGLITRADVQRFVEKAPNRALSAMAAMAVTTANSKRDIPHFYATRDLELMSAVQWRDRWNATQNGVHASFNDVFVWCAAHALGDVPRLNLAYRNGAFEQRSAADVLLVVARAWLEGLHSSNARQRGAGQFRTGGASAGDLQSRHVRRKGVRSYHPPGMLLRAGDRRGARSAGRAQRRGDSRMDRDGDPLGGSSGDRRHRCRAFSRKDAVSFEFTMTGTTIAKAAGLSDPERIRMFRRMLLCRMFEDRVYYLFLQGRMPSIRRRGKRLPRWAYARRSRLAI